MTENQSSGTARIEYVHTAAFSLNIAFVVIALILLYAPYAVISRFNQVEFSINRLLDIRQTDLVLGYWEFFLPGAILAMCIWVLLRLSFHTVLTTEILRRLAGIAALAGPPAYWLCATYAATRRYGWSPFRAVQLYELALILTLASLYVRGKWPVPSWASVVILLTHYGFWFWQFWPQLLMAFKGYGGAPGLTSLTGFFAGLTWISYVQRGRLGKSGTDGTFSGN